MKLKWIYTSRQRMEVSRYHAKWLSKLLRAHPDQYLLTCGSRLLHWRNLSTMRISEINVKLKGAWSPRHTATEIIRGGSQSKEQLDIGTSTFLWFDRKTSTTPSCSGPIPAQMSRANSVPGAIFSHLMFEMNFYHFHHFSWEKIQ